jgi:hypothetical protein
MSLTSPRHAASAMNIPDRRCGLETVATLLACLAIAGGVAWGPVSAMVAQSLRPARLLQSPLLSDTEVQAVLAPARQQLWLLTVIYFTALVGLAAATILVGRRALEGWVSERQLAHLGAWAGWLLVGGLALGLIPILILLLLPGGSSFLPAVTGPLLISLVLAGAVGSAMLASIALRQPVSTPASIDTETSLRAWRGKTRFCLGMAILIALAVFALLTWAAQVILGFYPRILW